MNHSARDLVLLLQDLGERERDTDELEAAHPRLQHLLATTLGPPTLDDH